MHREIENSPAALVNDTRPSRARGLRIAQLATADMTVARLLADHIHMLEDAGHDVTAICGPGSHVDSIREMGIQVIILPMARELRPYRDVGSLLELVRCFRQHRFDVVHTHTPKAGLIGPIAARLAGVRIVVHTIHGLLFHDGMPAWRRGLFWMPEKITATFSDHLLSQTQEDIDVAIRTRLCSAEKIRYLGNGINVGAFTPGKGSGDLRQPLGIEGDDIVIGSAGRLVAEKGFEELFSAIAILAARHDRVRFVVVGPQEADQDDAIDPARIEALKPIIHFAGWQSEMRPWYEIMDIFVLPSHREGIPRACMEAAAMELPVVTSDIRGCREVVVDGLTGRLLPLRDVPAIVDAVEALIADEALRREMGRRGRERITRLFDRELVHRRLRTFYDELRVVSYAP